MSLKGFIIGIAALAFAAPAAAQTRGTVEFGAFGSVGRFDKALTLNSGYGAGGRVGIYLDPRWALEFEKGEMRASRTLGLRDVNVGILAVHLVATPVKAGRLSLMIGGGAGAGTETNFMHTYGVNAMVGAKLALSNSVALRVDGISDWFANEDWKSSQRLHVGLSFYRKPRGTVQTVVRTVEVPGPVVPYVQRPDSVSAAEQARLRRAEQDYRNLRDSLSRSRFVPAPEPGPSSSSVATMEERIHFATDRSDINPVAKAILDSKVAVFRDNPEMRISIVGNTDERASDRYNMSLGARRSSAAKAYLVSRGIDANRIDISSDGERNPTATGTTTTAQGLNRRAEFRLVLVTDSQLKQ